MKIKTDKRYVILPVNENLTCTKKVIFALDGEPVYQLDVRLDPQNPTFYSYIDISRFAGGELTVSADPDIPFEVSYADSIDERAEYSGHNRPRVHFTAPKGWLNDPNGLCKYKDTYHLFYQYNPADTVWGNMHWGHAISKDLIHWENRPIALYPDMQGTIYSGCAFIDEKNVSGLGEGGEPPILFFYTYNIKGRTQNIAYSTDGGMTLKNYEGGPAVKHIIGGNRDPKVIYSPELGKYLMALYLIDDRFMLLTSDNLLDWKEHQELTLPGDNECPDIYRLPLDGEYYYVFKGAHSIVRIGRFVDGIFTPVCEDRMLQYDDGRSYASQSFEADGRRIDIAWQRRVTVPGCGFSGQMSIPTECTLRRIFDADGKEQIRLCQNPIKEIESLYGDVFDEKDVLLVGKTVIDACKGAIDISLKCGYDPNGKIELCIFGEKLVVDMEKNYIGNSKVGMPISIARDNVDVRIIADKLTLEIFTDGGAHALMMGAYADYNLPALTVKGKDAVIDRLCVAGLKSIWK